LDKPIQKVLSHFFYPRLHLPSRRDTACRYGGDGVAGGTMLAHGVTAEACKGLCLKAF
jgi:hypothetical protein